MTRLRSLFILLALVLAGLAYSQSTLGNMFRLGGSTTANLPASSTYTVGALIYDLDAGVPRYNNGASWQSLSGSSGSGDFWVDAGFVTTAVTGAVQTVGLNTTTAMVNNSDAGPSLVIGGYGMMLQATGSTQPMIAFNSDTSNITPSNTTAWIYKAASGGGGVVGGLNIQSVSPVQFSFNTFGITAAKTLTLYGTYTENHVPVQSQVLPSAGNPNAFQILNTGTRIDFGNGTDDYLFSDDGGIVSPGYVRFLGYNDAGIPNAANKQGAITYNTSIGAPVWSDGTSWHTVPREWVYSGYGNDVIATDRIVQQTRMQAPGKVLRLSATVLVAGTGANNAIVEVYNVTTAQSLCSRTFVCSTGLGGVTSAGCALDDGGISAWTSLDDVALRFHTTTCDTAPAVNIAAAMAGN